MRSLAPMTHALMALLDSMLLAGLLRAMCTLFPFTSLPHSNSPTLTQALIKSQALQEVAVVFFDPHTGAPIERVTFDVKVRRVTFDVKVRRVTFDVKVQVLRVTFE